MGQGRGLGFGLIGLGVILALLVISWLATTAENAGGVVLGLVLGAFLALPPIGAGLLVLNKSKQDDVETREFVGRRRVLEQDRLFRSQIAAEAAQQAGRLEALARGEPRLTRAAARLAQVADGLEAPGYDQAAWYEAVKLADQDVAALEQYDTLVSERLRRVSGQVDTLELGERQDPAEVLRTVQAWERDLDQRTELLRGERAPSVAPSELLRAGEPARGGDAIAALVRGDAVTYEEGDYVVELSVAYFASGRSWKLHRLRGAEVEERWLYVAPGALSFALLRPVPPAGTETAPQVQVDGTAYRLEDQGAAGVTVDSASGVQDGIAVDYRHYEAPSGELYWHERWPDGPRAYQGAPIKPRLLEVWPAERGAPS